MLAIVLTSLLSLPIYPLNPVKQDTVDAMSFHLTAGVASPSELVTVGPEFSVKYEFLFAHSYLLRAGLDFRMGRVAGFKYPQGKVRELTTSFEALYYRGTNHMTGFVGAGVVYNRGFIELDDNVADSILAAEQIDHVGMQGSFGYRVIVGLRRSKSWSFEIRMTDLDSKLVYHRDLGPYRYSEQTEDVKLSDFRVTVGYLISL